MDRQASPKKVQRIAVGLIWQGDLLAVGCRSQGTVLAGYDEFPGGKCEPGESAEEAAVRECLEETGLLVEILRLRLVVQHQYEHGLLELSFFDCEPVVKSQDPPEMTTPFRWMHIEEVVRLRFPPANDAIIASLQSRPGSARVKE